MPDQELAESLARWLVPEPVGRLAAARLRHGLDLDHARGPRCTCCTTGAGTRRRSPPPHRFATSSPTRTVVPGSTLQLGAWDVRVFAQLNLTATDERKVTPMTDTTLDDAALTTALNALTLEEKVQLLTGRDFWNTWPIEKIGLRRILVSDGPSGVRGETWDERDPSLNLPSATALASAWDPDIARRYGAAAAVEARRKGVDVVLGPTINLHRSPLDGRHFECFSEDPVLTAELAAAYVRGVQDNGVGATPKHYIANDSETDRFTVDVQVDERALRELYLLAFEKAITEAQAWLVMSSYNSVNGATATENELLETPLNSEWGFDGVVVSDWTAVRSLESASASQDLVMPGPDGPWGAALVKAVEPGTSTSRSWTARCCASCGWRSGSARSTGTSPCGAGARRGRPRVRPRGGGRGHGAVGERQRGRSCRWDADALRSVAVIGDNAANARTQGGGSATVLPAYTVSPLAGLRAALPDAEVTYSVGAVSQTGLADLPLDQLTNPVTGRARCAGAVRGRRRRRAVRRGPAQDRAAGLVRRRRADQRRRPRSS